MNGPEARSLVRRGSVGTATVTIDVAQGGGSRRATGTFTVSDPRADIALEMTEIGWLQTAGDWASFTGRARLRPSDVERSVLVIVDGPTLFVDTAGYGLTGALQP